MAAAAPPPELEEWLSSLRLGHYADAAAAWWESNGAATLEEVFENVDTFSEDLGLKLLERKRASKDAAQRLAAESGAAPAAPAPLAAPPAPPPECAARGAAADVRAGCAATTVGPPEDPLRYALLEEIGFGVTSKVYRCRRGKEEFAAKAIGLRKLRRQPGFQRVSDRFHQEISILLSLRHRRVVKLVDIVEEPDCLYLIMELVQGGDLSEWIVRRGSFGEPAARHVFLQMVEGLSYIHSKGIMYRDLKPDNILVDEAASCGEMLDVKLSDFGHSRLICDEVNTTLTARVGTAMYWAPEVSDCAKAALGYDQTSDLWSLGVVLYVMLIGFFPFACGDHVEDRLEREVRDLCFRSRPSGADLSEEAQDLIRSLLAIDPGSRLPLRQCLVHPWLAMPGAVQSEWSLGFLKLASEASAVEVRVPLMMKPGPDELLELRGHLQRWMYRFKYFATIRQGEVIANLGDPALADLPEQVAARAELQGIVERHCGRGMIVVNSQRLWTAIAESRGPAPPDAPCDAPQAGAQSPAPQPRGLPGRGATAAACARGAEPAACGGPAPCRPRAPEPAAAACAPTEPPARAFAPALRALRGGAAADAAAARPARAARRPPEARGAGPARAPDHGALSLKAVAALQGLWVSTSNATETYRVEGMSVLRSRGSDVRSFSLRWNTAQARLEWGISGKFFLQEPPGAAPMDVAEWLPSAATGRGFAWRRLSA